MKKSYIILILISLISIGCTFREVKAPKDEMIGGRPSWFFSPTQGKYKYGGVGVAGRSTRGLSGQRQLAISRAVDELAIQIGVSVENVIETTQKQTSSTYQSYSIQSTTGEVFQAILMDIWIDERTRELFAWMVIE